MKKQITFICEICGTTYNTEKEALKCENRVRELTSLKVGDVVFAKSGFGWFNGDIRWVSNPKVLSKPPEKRCKHNCFSSCCTYSFYYVITAIDRDDRDAHRLRIHLFTEAMKNDYRSGYTFLTGHYLPKVAKRVPKFVRDDAKRLVGMKADYLL